MRMLPSWKQRYPIAFWFVLFGCLVVQRCAVAFNNDDGTANVVETPKRKSNQDSSSSSFVEYANQECSISETDCRAYATSKNLRFVRLSSNNNATNNNSNSQRPGGCFVDTTNDKYRVFYNARNDTDNSNITSTSNTADSNGYYCNLSYRSVCRANNPPTTCYGYFCDQTLDTMFIFMTHNSYAVRGKITIYNQNHDESKQFRAGIRGFNFDIYDETNNDFGQEQELLVDHTPNSQTWNPQRYRDSVENVLLELDKCENRYEIVVVELEMKKSGKLTNQRALEPWGDKVIRNYNPSLPFSYYIQKGQRVLVTTNKAREGNPNIGMHVRSELFVQNGYDWKCATNNQPDFSYREGPLYQDKAARLMNHFCYNAIGLPDTSDSKRVNGLKVLQTNARTYRDKFGGWPNVILVDFYEQGNIWPAQELFRSNNKDMILLEDGQVCDTATTCEYCINNHSYWYSKAATACGTEPCWEDGRTCKRPSCDSVCCSGSFEYWMSLRSTACGEEPKFEENCREQGDFCYKNYSCDECCSNDIECPWYGFGLGCFCV